MAEILDKIQQEIDKAVKKRERYKNLVNGKVDLLNKLRTQVQECIQKVSSSSFENKGIYKSKLISAEESIDQILNDSAPLINRFNRDTINLGVAGATQAGKSTLLEAISGVQLPRAKGKHAGDSTTAAKSVIINSSEKRAIVYFRNKQQFIELVKAYLPEQYKNDVSDIADFENLNLDRIYENSSDSTERYEISKLQEAQKSLPYLKEHIKDNHQKEIDLADLADYVTYFQGKDDNIHFWPVVKVVKIYCPFTALGNNQIKLTLVDLPGMGECPRVDIDMVNGLNNEVDTVLLLFKTNAVQPDRDFKTFDAIKGAQKFVKDKTKFLSFFINKVEGDINLEGQINSIKKRIEQNFTHNDEEYRDYETAVLNNDGSFNNAKVHQDVINVLTKLVGDIDSLDSDTYNGWISQLDVTELKKQVNEIANQIKDDLPYSADDDNVLDDKKTDLKGAFADYNDLEDSYAVKKTIKEISREINVKLNEISTKIENLPLGMEEKEWETYFVEKRKEYKGLGIITPELIRLWTYIRGEYREIEKTADKFLKKLKNDIIDKFNEIVGKEMQGRKFITLGEDDGIGELLGKIEGSDFEMPMIQSAFQSLQDDQISFNQLVYQYIVGAELFKSISNDAKKGGLISDDSFKVAEGSSDNEECNHFKHKLTHIVLDVNKEMAEIISDKTPFAVAAYLYAKTEYFNDCLNRSTFDEKKKDRCFKNFCKAFRLELWPNIFGNSSETVIAREISAALDSITKLINQLNK
ncbi:MAG: dynamin family protein [Bacteroidales bacterium]|nr:dynamin family protein [Bacteroidales bacterium]